MKKIVMILMVVLLSFALNLVFPYKQAHAIGPLIAAEAAVPVGITIGAGAYTLGALGLAGLVGIAGYDTYSEEINAHALRSWENSTDLAKSSIDLMVKQAVGLGDIMVSTDAAFNSWVENQVSGIGQFVASLQVPNAVAESGNYTWEKRAGVLILKFASGSALSATWSAANHNRGTQIDFYAASDGSIEYRSAAGTMYAPTGMTQDELVAVFNSVTTPFQMAQLWNSYIMNSSNPAYTMNVVVANPDWNSAYTTGVSKVREAWQDMKDAGLVLPVDSAVPVYQGNIASYNPTSDVYTGVDGGVIAKGDLTWSFPQPRIRTGEELDVTVPPGVYVDNPAGVYNPSLPTTAIPDIAIPTTTNITTGISTPITKTGTGEPLPGTGTTTPKTGEPLNPFKVKPMPIAALTGLFQLLAALIFYLIRMFTFIATIALIAPTPIDNPYFLWFIDATFYGIKPFRLVQNLALFFLGFSVYRSVRRVFG